MVLSETTMYAEATQLADYLVERIRSSSTTSRIIVGVAGVPASGKSTLSRLVVDRINATFRPKPDANAGNGEEASDIAVMVGLDGWHLTRAQLDTFPDPKLAHDRRGAHWTFDGQGYVEFVRALRRPLPSPAEIIEPLTEENIVHAPSFDHALKDPKPNDISVCPHHRLVLIEGLYVFLGIAPWREASELLDERWWIDIGEEEAETRLVARHVRSGVAKDLDEAIWRSRENDAPNGRFIRENMLEPTRIIQSQEDPLLSTA